MTPMKIVDKFLKTVGNVVSLVFGIGWLIGITGRTVIIRDVDFDDEDTSEETDIQ